MISGLTIGAALASLAVGARDLPWGDVLVALFRFDPSRAADVIIWEMRVTRTITGLAVGAALAAAGLVMQQISRNPLADPGILGINGGAALGVVLSIWFLGWRDPLSQSGVAVAGAGLAALFVYLLGRGGRAADSAAILRLTLAGIAVSALCLAVVSAVVLIDQGTRNLYRFWTIGSLAEDSQGRLWWLLPLIAAGLAIAALMSRKMDALALGADSARSFGISVPVTVGAALLSVALLAGGAVALAGPIGFVGLIVPHVTRRLVGPSILPGLLVAVPMGGAVLLLCDVVGRILARPAEIQTGIILALIGGPVFLALMAKVVR
ncbi:iron ABC transporter permease [Paracoccus sp. 11-3]|uniref:Iron ABC transporter permease n=1 Tax=Paracoccus amoyensis TaxID=2760093 RepID=A0A926JDG3_9RHOB|nr:iron ABC transporter permease [Paracoccus amoyensis]MBC9247584.1 iron ABC transporter permease [Paracoccus amoyensis]